MDTKSLMIWFGVLQKSIPFELIGPRLNMSVKLVLRDKEYEVKPGMTLLSSLEKIGVLPESVIASRAGELILEDEILKDGEVIKLIAVISGG